MRHYVKEEIESLEKIYRLNLINGISGYKPANLIGTVSEKGITNLAINSSVVHLGSKPAILGFIIRPATVPRHTLENIRKTGVYSINHVHLAFTDKAHYTSAKFDKDVSEFQKAGLTIEFLDDFKAPYVKESEIKIGVKLQEELKIKSNGTYLIVGEIQHIYLPEEIIGKNGILDLNLVEDVCISGLNTYHSVVSVAEYPYARPGDFPIGI
jgi:flavin reductase (DIM6/NTAB) family NADH-FMN oxidoreductase RutF